MAALQKYALQTTYTPYGLLKTMAYALSADAVVVYDPVATLLVFYHYKRFAFAVGSEGVFYQTGGGVYRAPLRAAAEKLFCRAVVLLCALSAEPALNALARGVSKTHGADCAPTTDAPARERQEHELAAALGSLNALLAAAPQLRTLTTVQLFAQMAFT